MKQKDILIIARPDQSLQIYRSLEIQNKLSYDYLTFKVFPKWIKKIINHNKMVEVGKNAHTTYWGTFVHFAVQRFNVRFVRNWTDRNILNRSGMRLIKSYSYKICHYWPENVGIPFEQCQSVNEKCFVIADIHMPYPEVVYDEMLPIYQKYGINPKMTHLFKIKKTQSDYADRVKNILVPSIYVADTYMTKYPKKNYYVVPYGIAINKKYQKKVSVHVKNIVYVGTVSLEKGCDLILEFFKNNPSYNLHLYGSIINEQHFIFDSYQDLPNIIFHGQVARSQLSEELPKYDAAVHMSRFDAYSLGVGEIIGCGIPTIVTTKTGNCDDILKYGLGLVTEPTYEGLEKAFHNLMNENIYVAIIENIHQYIQTGAKTYGENMIAFYHDVLNNQLTKYSYDVVKYEYKNVK